MQYTKTQLLSILLALASVASAAPAGPDARNGAAVVPAKGLPQTSSSHVAGSLDGLGSVQVEAHSQSAAPGKLSSSGNKGSTSSASVTQDGGDDDEDNSSDDSASGDDSQGQTQSDDTNASQGESGDNQSESGGQIELISAQVPSPPKYGSPSSGSKPGNGASSGSSSSGGSSYGPGSYMPGMDSQVMGIGKPVPMGPSDPNSRQLAKGLKDLIAEPGKNVAANGVAKTSAEIDRKLDRLGNDIAAVDDKTSAAGGDKTSGKDNNGKPQTGGKDQSGSSGQHMPDNKGSGSNSASHGYYGY